MLDEKQKQRDIARMKRRLEYALSLGFPPYQAHRMRYKSKKVIKQLFEEFEQVNISSGVKQHFFPKKGSEQNAIK